MSTWTKVRDERLVAESEGVYLGDGGQVIKMERADVHDFTIIVSCIKVGTPKAKCD